MSTQCPLQDLTHGCRLHHAEALEKLTGIVFTGPFDVLAGNYAIAAYAICLFVLLQWLTLRHGRQVQGQGTTCCLRPALAVLH